jgi:predicted hydrocarbon binding protein
MKETKKRTFPLHYAPGKKLFHIVVKLSDLPGSYSSILELLRSKVNLIGTTTYSLSDGTAMFSGFAESLFKNQTPRDIERIIRGSRASLEVMVTQSEHGLLVDTFHRGLVVDSEDYMLLRRGGLTHMFDQVAKMLGSGGEALLYQEGFTLCQMDSEDMIRMIGLDQVKAQYDVLNRVLAAEGWGVLVPKKARKSGSFSVVVQDCFECSEGAKSRTGCNFMRGYLVGAMEKIYGFEAECNEVKCVLKGAPACEFVIGPRKQP